jgi:hypothetical protein
MRCPECGATNPATARWCGQCYAALADDKPAARAEASTPAEPRADQDAPDGPSAGPGGSPEVDRAAPAPGGSVEPHAATGGTEAAVRDGFRRRGDVVEWACVACGTFNGLEQSVCSVCGTAFAARFTTPEPAPEPPSWGAALGLSAVLPGTGHYLAGQAGSGAARALLYVVWLAGGMVLLLSAGTAAAAAAVPLLLGALVVWGGSLLDLVSLRDGGRQLLSGRTLLWLVVGVTVLLLLGAFGGAARVT